MAKKVKKEVKQPEPFKHEYCQASTGQGDITAEGSGQSATASEPE